MEQRIQIDALEPEAYKALYHLSQLVANAGLTSTHQALIKVRASQVNGCAFCIDMHTKEALKQGETPQRLFLLNAWRETTLFTEEERVLLQVTEEVTLVHRLGLTPETYAKAISLFGDRYLAQIIMTVTVINAWNRVAVSTNKPF
jgi:AhpD family alkylhydroperoxidase